MGDHELAAAISAEHDRLVPLVARQDAALSMAASAPRIVGHVRASLAARNWWAVAGWSLRAVDTALIEIGHARHDPAQHRTRVDHYRQANHAARDAVPDDTVPNGADHQQRREVYARRARRAPGYEARRGNLIGASVYVLGRAALRVHRRRAWPLGRSVLPVPARRRRLSAAALAGGSDLARYLSPALADHRGD